MRQRNDPPEFEFMQEKIQPRKRYIFASDFDQTLSFNDSGYVLGEILGISASEFERKTTGMTKLNLVQQGGELAYYTPWQLLPITAGAVILICILSSLLSVRRVIVLEPAVVFRG